MRNVFRVATVLAVSAFASAALAVDVDSKSGQVQFTGPNSGHAKVSLGKRIKFDPEFKQIHIGKGNAVNVGAEAQNTTDQKVFYSYHVAFLDKDKNLIGCQAFNLWIDASKKARIGTFIALPPEQIAKIASYSVVFYEDDEQIGNK